MQPSRRTERSHAKYEFSRYLCNEDRRNELLIIPWWWKLIHDYGQGNFMIEKSTIDRYREPLLTSVRYELDDVRKTTIYHHNT
ncbi:hypothetical protein MUK42_19912 [Musa troglodytarum]|uniref:Uncharacterized protein n=1 Tax=Musa troglodytarum TaxID=320322 RepID=A0A9E7JI39_9LILI|nr:hypothetical protein MUK42_19912 [Musa troglodytarum]